MKRRTHKKKIILMYHDLQFEQHLHSVYNNQVGRRIEMLTCQQQALQLPIKTRLTGCSRFGFCMCIFYVHSSDDSILQRPYSATSRSRIIHAVLIGDHSARYVSDRFTQIFSHQLLRFLFCHLCQNK